MILLVKDANGNIIGLLEPGTCTKVDGTSAHAEFEADDNNDRVISISAITAGITYAVNTEATADSTPLLENSKEDFLLKAGSYLSVLGGVVKVTEMK